MGSPDADKLDAYAKKLEAKIKDPGTTDDPRWLRRWADRLRLWAALKEKGFEHKHAQKKKRRSRRAT